VSSWATLAQVCTSESCPVQGSKVWNPNHYVRRLEICWVLVRTHWAVIDRLTIHSELADNLTQCQFSFMDAAAHHLVGKTTVAGIYGRILADLGLLSKGEVIIKSPSDFIGNVLGDSEKKTAALLEEARGCVLVIDEAYGLHDQGGKNPFKVSVLSATCKSWSSVPVSVHTSVDVSLETFLLLLTLHYIHSTDRHATARCPSACMHACLHALPGLPSILSGI
jgi:hypothetical protein